MRKMQTNTKKERIPIGTAEHPLVMRINRNSFQPSALFSDTANEMIEEYGAEAIRVKHLLNSVPYLSFVTREEAGKHEDGSMLTTVNKESKRYRIGSKKTIEEILLDAPAEVKAEPLIDVVLVPMKDTDLGSLFDMEIRAYKKASREDGEERNETTGLRGQTIREEEDKEEQKTKREQEQVSETKKPDNIRLAVEKLSSGYVMRDDDGWSECFESEGSLHGAIMDQVDNATMADDYDMGYILDIRIKPVESAEEFYRFMEGGAR